MLFLLRNRVAQIQAGVRQIAIMTPAYAYSDDRTLSKAPILSLADTLQYKLAVQSDVDSLNIFRDYSFLKKTELLSLWRFTGNRYKRLHTNVYKAVNNAEKKGEVAHRNTVEAVEYITLHASEVIALSEELDIQLQSYYEDLQTRKTFTIWVFCLLGLSLCIIVVLAFYYRLVVPLKQTKEVLDNINNEHYRVAENKSNDLTQPIIDSVKHLRKDLLNATSFANTIGSGSFDAALRVNSENDKLNAALLNMRDQLMKISAEEKRRNWLIEGSSRVNQLLRQMADRDLEEACSAFVDFVVKYADLPQAGIYIHDDETNKLNLIAQYAYQQKKFVKNQINDDEGSVGQCFQEAHIIVIEEVPQNYLTISSGMGKAQPTFVMLLPLMFNDENCGVMEMATFKELPDHYIEFLQQSCNNLASLISIFFSNQKTKELLKQARATKEKMLVQEEELKQKTEMLEITFTEFDKQLKDSQEQVKANQGIVDATYKNYAVARMNMKADITDINKTFADKLGYSTEDLLNTNEVIQIPNNDNERIAFDFLWDNLKKGKVQRGQFKRLSRSGAEIVIKGSYTPIVGKKRQVPRSDTNCSVVRRIST